MKELVDKIKSLDQKILIGAGVVFAFVVVLMIAFIIGGNDTPANNDNTQNQTEVNSQLDSEEDSDSLLSGTETETEFETELGTEAGTEVDEGTEVETEVETEGTMSENDSESEEKDNSEVESDSTGSAKPDEEPLGKGSKNDPYMDILGNDMTVATESIPAGKAVYYSVQRVGGLILTIENANAYVITADGKRYDAQNGKVSLQLETAMASEYVSFQIGNKGASATSFTLKFANAYGSRQNPETIATIGQYKKSLAAGNEVGYYYKYTVEKSGKLRFYLTATTDSEMTVTNNRNSATRTFEADGLTDEQGREYIELDVAKGDTIMIHVTAIPNKRGKYPASDITWEGIYK